MSNVTESFYATRLRSYLVEHYWQEPRVYRSMWWLHGKRCDRPLDIEESNFELHDLPMGHFHAVIVQTNYRWRELFDSNGDVITDYVRDDSQIASRGNWTDSVNYQCYVYRTGTKADDFATLNYPYQFAQFHGVSSNSLKEITKKINKKLNVLNKVADNLDELITLCREPVSRFAKNAYEVPYNVNVGDHVFVPAFGYWRKGKVLATSGAKFIVGYVTPSNTFDLKYKSVCLADLRIEKVTP